MNAYQVYQQLTQYTKGQHLPVTWQRTAETYKTCPHVVGKRVRAYVRAGIHYANMKAVKDAIAAGLRGPVQPLPWGQWRNGFEPFIIDHETKSGELREYIRLYPASFQNLGEPEIEWTIDGKPATYGQIEPYLTAAEKKTEDKTCFNVNVEHIVKIG